MVTLNGAYQYIGRSNAVSCPSGYKYYILLYARASTDVGREEQHVTIRMRIACDMDSSFYGWRTSASAKVDGETAFEWSNEQIPSASWGEGLLTEGGYTYKRWREIGNGSALVSQPGGKEKEITISSSWVMNDADSSKGWLPNKGEYATVSIKVKLPPVEYASAITTSQRTTFTYGAGCRISWTPKSASFSYTLSFTSGVESFNTEIIRPNRTTSYTYDAFTIPIELAEHAIDGTGSITVTLATYSDSDASTFIGMDTKDFTAIVQETDETKPTISMSLAPVSTLREPFDSMYLQGKSKVRAVLDISTKYLASVVESNITVDGIVYGEPYESGYLTKSGVLTVKGSVKDSRGFYGFCDSDITVIPYSKPKVQAVSGENNVVAARCDAYGNLSSKGTYLKIKAKIGYEKVIADGVQNNFGKLQYRYRAVGDVPYSEWQTLLDTETSEAEEIVTEPMLNGEMSFKTGYQVQVRAIDYIDESELITLFVASDSVYVDRPAGGRSMGLGGYSTGDGKLDVYWRTMARGGLSLFNEDGEEISVDDTLPLPRGLLADGWNPDSIANGVHQVSGYPLADKEGSVLMEDGVLIQLAVTADGSVLLQMAFPADVYAPVYRIKQNDAWSDWKTMKL